MTDSAGRRSGANAGYVWTCQALQNAFVGAASAGLLGNGKILDFVWVSEAYCAATYDAVTGKLSLFGMNEDSGRPILLGIASLDAILGAIKSVA
jgi:hypothetical protein